jgi:hypothetical protein
MRGKLQPILAKPVSSFGRGRDGPRQGTQLVFRKESRHIIPSEHGRQARADLHRQPISARHSAAYHDPIPARGDAEGRAEGRHAVGIIMNLRVRFSVSSGRWVEGELTTEGGHFALSAEICGSQLVLFTFYVFRRSRVLQFFATWIALSFGKRVPICLRDCHRNGINGSNVLAIRPIWPADFTCCVEFETDAEMERFSHEMFEGKILQPIE